MLRKIMSSNFSKNFSINHLSSIVSQFYEHLNIKKIKKGFQSLNANNFEKVTLKLLNLIVKKLLINSLIPAINLKQSVKIYFSCLPRSVKFTLNEGNFLTKLKRSEVILSFGKQFPSNKNKYKPVSLLPDVSNNLQENHI